MCTVSFVVNFVNFGSFLDVVADHFLEHLKFNFGESTVVVELVVDLLDCREVIFSDKDRGLFNFSHSLVNAFLNFLHFTQVVHDELKDVFKAL